MEAERKTGSASSWFGFPKAAFFSPFREKLRRAHKKGGEGGICGLAVRTLGALSCIELRVRVNGSEFYGWALASSDLGSVWISFLFVLCLDTIGSVPLVTVYTQTLKSDVAASWTWDLEEKLVTYGHVRGRAPVDCLWNQDHLRTPRQQPRVFFEKV